MAHHPITGQETLTGLVRVPTPTPDAAAAGGVPWPDRGRALFEGSPCPVLLARRADFHVLEVNAACCRAIGFSREALTSPGFARRWLWRGQPQYRAFCDALDAAGRITDFVAEIRSGADGVQRVLLDAVALIEQGEPRLLVWLKMPDATAESVPAPRAGLAQFQAAFRDSPLAMIVSREEDGGIVDANPAAGRLLGYEVVTLLAPACTDLEIWGDPAGRERMIAQLASAGFVREHPTVIVTRRGARRQVRTTVSRVVAGGRPYLLSVIRDVTEELAVQAELAASERKFAALFRGGVEPLTISRLENGRFLDVNDAFCEVSGYSRQELIGVSAGDLRLYVEPGTRESLLDALRAGPLRDRDYRLRRKNGSVLDMRVSFFSIPWDGGTLLMGIGRVVTDLLRQERATADANRLFAAAFDANPHPMSISRTGDGVVLEVNDAYARVFGRGREDMIGATTVQRGLWVDAAGRADWIASVRAAGGTLVGYEAALRHQTGALLECSIDARIVRMGGDECVMAVVRDLTSERAAARATRATVGRLAAVFKSSPDGITISRLEDGAIVDANEGFLKLTGFSLEEVIGRGVIDLGILIDPEQRVRFREALAERGFVRDVPWRLRSRDGRILDCTITGYVLHEQCETLLVGVVRDETAALRMAGALRASERMLKSLLDALPLPVFWKDREGRYLGGNNAFVQAAGFDSVDAIIGLTDDAFHWVATAGEKRALDRLVMDSGAPIPPYEEFGPNGDGNWRWQLKTKVPLRDAEGQVLGVLSVATDVTELKGAQAELLRLNHCLESKVAERTEALRSSNEELVLALERLQRAQDDLVEAAKLAALGSLVAGVSHELNTPIGNALMAATTLLGQVRSLAASVSTGLTRDAMDDFLDSGQEGARMVVHNLERASELITSFKQVAIDRASSQRRSFRLRELVAETVLSVTPRLRRTNVTVSHDIPEALVLDSFPGPLGQVLGNLIENAAVHGFEGLENGQIRITADAPGTGRVSICIADGGRGISPEHRVRLFEPFFTTRPGRGGSGLGLVVCRNIVTGILGGRMDLQSEPGKGTSARVDIPQRAPGDQGPFPLRS